MEEKDKKKCYMVYFKPSPVYAEDLERAKDTAYAYMGELVDDWIEIDDVHLQE